MRWKCICWNCIKSCLHGVLYISGYVNGGKCEHTCTIVNTIVVSFFLNVEVLLNTLLKGNQNALTIIAVIIPQKVFNKEPCFNSERKKYGCMMTVNWNICTTYLKKRNMFFFGAIHHALSLGRKKIIPRRKLIAQITMCE